MLDENNTSPSYLYGRLYACYTKIAAHTPEEDWVRRKMDRMTLLPFEVCGEVLAQIWPYVHKRPNVEAQMSQIIGLMDDQRQAGADLKAPLDGSFFHSYYAQMRLGKE